MNSTITVVVVDDEEVLRAASSDLLEEAGGFEIVGRAANGEEAIACVERQRPQVVLMDLRMPVMDGIEATRRIREAAPDVAVLAHTAYGDDSLVLESLQAGASGYVLKGASAYELMTAILSVAEGRVHIDDEVMSPVVEKLLNALAYERQTRIDAERAATELQRLSVQRREFAIQAAHELRTPLTSVLGNLELVCEDGISAADASTLAKRALEAARRLQKLVENLEVTAGIDTFGLDVKPCALGSVIDRVLAETGVKKARCDVPESLSAMVDSHCLERALTNVLTNARLASPPGATVSVMATQAGSHIVIEINDEGPGFEDDVLLHAFDAYELKANAPRGLGVGLWVARELLRRMGGEITASNGTNGGAHVELTLRDAA